MTIGLRTKLILAGLWLLCYFPFKEGFVSGEIPKVTIRLGELQRFEDVPTFERWQHCLTYLDSHNIKCSIRVKCGTDNFGDAKFLNWLSKREEKGHRVIHDDHCICNASSSNRSDPLLPTPQHVSFQAMWIGLPEPHLLLSEPSDFFKNHFQSLTTRTYHFIIEGDPTYWGEQQFGHFEENIQYLLVQGIRFDSRH